MKKLIISMLALGFLSACNVMDVNSRETTNQRFAREQRENNARQAAAERSAAQYAGGLPGKISVTGIVVNSKNQLDDRIQVSQTPGASFKPEFHASAADSKASLPNFNMSSNAGGTEKLSDDKNYVALGCASLGAAAVSGLKTKSIDEISKNVASISANTVVICGKTKLNYQFTTITAHRLMLINASLSTESSAGSLSLTTDQLVVLGKNKIQTQGLDAVASVPAAPALELNVLKAIDGDGSLQLISVGGNCTKK